MPDAPPPIQSPHDKFFKVIFSYPPAASDAFHLSLPPLVGELHWAEMALKAGSFVDEHLAESSSDLLYTVPWREQSIFLYLLFEHKSTPEEVRLNLLRYMVRIWEQARKETAQPPPAIVPVVLYHGKRPWPFSTRFVDWLGIPEGGRDKVARFQPDFEHALLDLSQVSFEQISGRLVTRLALTLMKAVQEGAVLKWMEAFGNLLLELGQEEGMTGQFQTMLRYLFQAEATAASTFKELAAKVPSAVLRQGIMTIEEQIKQEGWQKGRQEGRQALLLRLLTRRFGALEQPLVQRISSLSAEQQESLGEALLEFRSKADLDAWLAQP